MRHHRHHPSRLVRRRTAARAGRRRRGAAARADPELAAQVRLWQADREALRAQLDAMLHEPVPPRLTQAVWQGAPPRWRVALWAAGVALFVLGGASGAGLLAGLGAPQRALQAGSGEWLQRAAVAHAVYVPEKRHPVEVSVEQNQDGHLARWLTKRLDVPVKLFDLDPAGLRARRRPPAARRARAERAADVPERRRASASPSTCASPTPARPTRPLLRSATSARASSACSTGSKARAPPPPATRWSAACRASSCWRWRRRSIGRVGRGSKPGRPDSTHVARYIRAMQITSESAEPH